jgi:enoyl-[acyl-carrier-protein] reductase (NADH)
MTGPGGDEVGAAAAWLASEQAAFVTGQVIHLSGGSTFGR